MCLQYDAARMVDYVNSTAPSYRLANPGNIVAEKAMRYSDTEVASKGVEIFGTKPALPSEIATAAHLLNSVPDGLTPLQVARHLEASTERNQDGELYTAEWKVRSNPMITLFFAATDYGTGGLTDQVPWCSAFVNWCLWRAGYKRSNKASSGSFRCFGKEAQPPKAGDIAVFKDRGEDAPCAGHGHVAFWLSQSAGFVSVLGGNQGNAINVSNYPAREAPHLSHWLVNVRETQK